MSAKIKKGDDVIVIAGKYKDKEGKVTKIFPDKGRVIVSGVALMKKHQKQTAQSEGGIITKEAPIDLSNVAIKDPKDGKPSRVGFQIKDGKKVRIAKRSGEVING